MSRSAGTSSNEWSVQPAVPSLPFYPGKGTFQNPDETRLLKLLDVVNELSSRDDIAYVWGGRSTSSQGVCLACRQCVESRRVEPSQRLGRCPACRQCGVDCSGFVSRALVDSGLGGRRVTSKSLLRSAKSSKSMFRAVGNDLKKARAGDLVVFDDHVILFLERYGRDQLAYVHAAKFVSGRRSGGIEVVVNGPLPQNMQPVVILRHKGLINAGISHEVRQRVQLVINSAIRRSLKKFPKKSDPTSDLSDRLVLAE